MGFIWVQSLPSQSQVSFKLPLCPQPPNISAVTRAALLTNEESKGIRVHLSNEGMVLSSRAPEQGEATIRLPVKYTGETLEIGFNPTFLIDAMKVCGETTTLELQAPAKPGLLRSDPDFVYVVMPVNLS